MHERACVGDSRIGTCLLYKWFVGGKWVGDLALVGGKEMFQDWALI